MRNVAMKESYPLSPLQQGMLYHNLLLPDSGVDIEQIICTLKEPINISLFKSAWQTVINRHPILRTDFQWEGIDEPVQVVAPEIDLVLEFQDLCQLPPKDQISQLETAIRDDRFGGFKMSKAPLMRLTLFQFAESHYRLLWTFHHALLDGRSFPLVLKEVFQLYDALIEKRDLVYEQPRPYQDYIEWLQDKDLAAAEKYWKETLAGFNAPTQLSIARTQDGTSRIASDVTAEEISLSSSFTSMLRTFADAHELTLNTLIQGAWATLLYHYSGEEDVVFGSVRACRHWTRHGAESMIGLFINTLPTRVRVSPDQLLFSFLKEIRKRNIRLRENEHTPLLKIQQWSDVAPGKNLFETMVVFENNTLNTAIRKLGNEWPQRDFLYLGQTNSPLTLLVYADPEMLLRLEYDRIRFDQQSVERMLGHLTTMLQTMVVDPDRPAAELGYVTDAERRQLLDDWNNTAVDYKLDKCLHQLFEAQVERTPDETALVYEDTQLTYRELNSQANKLAHYLRHIGVGPDVPVGICAERSIEMVVGLYAILKAGGAYVPLDPEYPQERLGFMLEDAQVPVILAQRRLIDILPHNDARLVYLDDSLPEEYLAEKQKQGFAADENPTCLTTPEHLAYIIFTSGSTGRPKGVMNPHRAICNRLLWMQDEYRLDDSDAVLQKTPYSFDVSVWEFFWPLLTGARLVVARPEGHKDSSYLIDGIRKYQITTIHFVPSMLQIFLEDPEVESCDSLKRVICSGEALPYELQQRFFERQKAELHNLYGPTEAAVDVTFWECRQDSSLRIVPIGRPVANTQMYILDNYLQPVPIGVPGELHIGGVQVARGYVNRPELTAEKFIADPFSEGPQARLYKTGDLCRFLPDGNIEYLGRNDFQVKIRGFRIEIGEIESVLLEHSDIRETVVMAREDTPGHKRLVAYLVAKEDPPGRDELRRFLKRKLPDYMVPAAFLTLDAFPLTFSGKINRRALPVPADERQTEEVYTPPRNEAEKTITEIWQKVLNVDRIGVNDNFFDLGGHSLLLVSVQARMRQANIHEMPITDFFRYPTISSLARYLTGEKSKIRSATKAHDLAEKQKTFLKRRRQKAFVRKGPVRKHNQSS